VYKTVYNTAMRDKMPRSKPSLHPELDERRSAPRKVMPGAAVFTEGVKGKHKNQGEQIERALVVSQP
jgi:hypothetical protein